jgi:AcrR family transcriptional regulator
MGSGYYDEVETSRALLTQSDGRWAQKQRTRRAILDAAGELVAEGVVPTVIQAAQRAQVSQATAYRYFSSQEAMLVEVTLPLPELHRAFEEVSDLDVPARVGAMVRATAQWCYDNQIVLREMLRTALDAERDYRRPGHRRDWIDEALEPIRDQLDAVSYRRLTANLSLYFGIDPIVVLETITDLGKDEGIDALVWGATALARAQLDELSTAPPSPRHMEH